MFWVEKWPKFTQRSLMSLLIFPVAFAKEGQWADFSAEKEVTLCLGKYYLMCLPRIDFQWCSLRGGLGILLGKTADDMQSYKWLAF